MLCNEYTNLWSHFPYQCVVSSSHHNNIVGLYVYNGNK